MYVVIKGQRKKEVKVFLHLNDVDQHGAISRLGNTDERPNFHLEVSTLRRSGDVTRNAITKEKKMVL